MKDCEKCTTKGGCAVELCPHGLGLDAMIGELVLEASQDKKSTKR